MKNELLLAILFSVLFVLMTACFDTSLEFEDQFEQVVEGYIYQDRPIEGLKISKMISFGDDTTGGQGIINASAELFRGDDSWLFILNEEDSSYYIAEDIDFYAGDTCKLKINYLDEEITAVTVIPDLPPSIDQSETSISIPYVTDMFDFRELTMPEPVRLSWENPEGRYVFIRIQNIESNPYSIMPDPPDDMPFKHPNFVFQMDTEPTNGTFYEINSRELTHFGTHQIIVYGVNQEYVSLYNSIDQDSRELNEPYTNVSNGLGIFTAFSSDTLYLEVEME